MPTAYITVVTDKKGRIRKVQFGRKVLRAKRSKPGPNNPAQVGRGKTVGVLELLQGTHEDDARDSRGKGKGMDKDKEKDKENPTGGGTDPCCIRDPRTGNVYCWC